MLATAHFDLYRYWSRAGGGSTATALRRPYVVKAGSAVVE
jgi:hypothetical protein